MFTGDRYRTKHQVYPIRMGKTHIRTIIGIPRTEGGLNTTYRSYTKYFRSFQTLYTVSNPFYGNRGVRVRRTNRLTSNASRLLLLSSCPPRHHCALSSCLSMIIQSVIMPYFCITLFFDIQIPRRIAGVPLSSPLRYIPAAVFASRVHSAPFCFDSNQIEPKLTGRFHPPNVVQNKRYFPGG